MMRILITGSNSYTGTSIREHLSAWPEKYHVDTISLRGEGWKSESFSHFDTVIHTAGIAHDTRSGVLAHGTNSADKEAYYNVNTHLAIETARKAMREGVKHFVFMSSSIVYGKSAPIGKRKNITRGTPVSPESYYGDSKVQAENMLLPMDCEKFRVCVLRCPMIYGRGCKGNYPLLSKLALMLPVFPDVNNARSMLYVKNFAEYVRLMIDDRTHGIFWPQNGEYSRTSEIVRMIAESHRKKIILLPKCETPLKVLASFSGLVNKAFGSLTYDMSLSEYRTNYRLYALRESIMMTEGNVQ